LRILAGKNNLMEKSDEGSTSRSSTPSVKNPTIKSRKVSPAIYVKVDRNKIPPKLSNNGQKIEPKSKLQAKVESGKKMQSKRESSESKTESNKKLEPKVESSRKLGSKVDYSKIESKIDSGRKLVYKKCSINPKVETGKKVQSRIESVKKLESKVGSSQKSSSKVNSSRKLQSKVESGRKLQSKVEPGKKLETKVESGRNTLAGKQLPPDKKVKGKVDSGLRSKSTVRSSGQSTAKRDSSKSTERKPISSSNTSKSNERKSTIKTTSEAVKKGTPGLQPLSSAGKPSTTSAKPTEKPSTSSKKKVSKKTAIVPLHATSKAVPELDAIRRAGGPPNDGLVRCKVCGRDFASERVDLHQQICKQSHNTSRKVFDSRRQRTQGTDLEPYARRGAYKNTVIVPKNRWREKHEEFIRSIRYAKQTQSHVAAGGKATDLPPPPPSDYSDYIQCPYCKRKFSPEAAERHIPKCQYIISNKPK